MDSAPSADSIRSHAAGIAVAIVQLTPADQRHESHNVLHRPHCPPPVGRRRAFHRVAARTASANGTVVKVSSEAQLQSAVQHLASNTTIVIVGIGGQLPGLAAIGLHNPEILMPSGIRGIDDLSILRPIQPQAVEAFTVTLSSTVLLDFSPSTMRPTE